MVLQGDCKGESGKHRCDARRLARGDKGLQNIGGDVGVRERVTH